MLKANLRKYQRKGVNTMLKKFNGRALLADDMGLGKTLQAITIISKMPDKMTLIVCPSPLKYNWVDEFKKFLPSVKPYVCKGQTPPPKSKIKNNIFICNYEIIQYWKDFFLKKKIDILFCDEGHYVKSKTAKRTKAVWSISNKCDMRFVLTGTPIENKPAELWSHLKIIDKDLFPSWLLFVKRYNGARRNQWGWQLNKATNVEELHGILKDKCMVRRKKEEVLKELPKKVRKVIPVDIENRKEYDKAETNIINWLKENTKLNIDKAKKAQAIIKLDK